MIKKTLASVAVLASAVGAAGAVATPAMAVGDTDGQKIANGNGAISAYGNTTTSGYMSPNISLINGSLNDICIAPPIHDIQAVQILAIPIQDILASDNNLACAENSTLNDGDDPLSHILSRISLLSENGATSVHGGGKH
ncbi:rodlin [Streptomyces sp. YIM 98790]|uniref:rodlin n=1 Tax=Streptomyces sp. YIM 98790 TaxID=2689077 RepID=UPI00140D106E|nr:rodlin [Streptomyces sp. YIM 98790]